MASRFSLRIVRKWVLRMGIGLGALLLVLVLVTALTPQGRSGFHTALFVTQILDAPVKPQSWFTADPVRQEITYEQDTGVGIADIYRIPDGQSRAAVLLFLGANAAGRDDKDVVKLGDALARAGFVTMFYWSPTMAFSYDIDSTEIENLVWAFKYLRAQDFVDQERVGMGGFCVGASFTLVAASDSRISDEVHFVNAFGPYYDARDLLLQISSRSQYYQDQRKPWEPDPLTIRVFANELIEAMDLPRDRIILSSVFLEGEEADPQELAKLSTGGRVVHRLLTGTSREEAESLYLSLPSDFRDDMRSISPSNNISHLKARVMIMHDRDDRLMPSVESRRLADALESRGDYRYTELLAFEHVRPAGGGSLWLSLKEGYKLFRHMYDIIRVSS